MRLASFNLLNGRSLRDGSVDPDRLGIAGRSLDVDVLGIQEVDWNQARSDCIDHTAAMADALGVDEDGWRFAPTLIGTPGDAWTAATDDVPAGAAAYGIGLISRLPVRAWHTIRLPAARLRSPVVIPGKRPRVLLLRDEPRAALAAVVDAGSMGLITVATTHLSFVPGWNVVQLHLLLRELRRLPGPQLLMGDLNLPGKLPAALTGWSSLGRVATFPAPAPRVQLDHALAHGLSREIVRSSLLSAVELPVSDHRALVVELPEAVGSAAGSAGVRRAASSAREGRLGRETRPSLT
jgi:endonuclease/exonuclease/phosphatase family metal-dependent hydrolase